jgi:hypothetical protein
MRPGDFTHRRPALRFVLFAVAAFLPALAAASSWSTKKEYFDYDDSLAEKWQESEVPVPTYPEERYLVPVPLPPDQRIKLYIDEKSVSRAPDRVLRLTLVVESPAGARSVFFEGVRCETRQYKTYAIGAQDTLQAVKQPLWQEIPRLPGNIFRHHLFRHYACDDTSSARTPRDFLERLKYGS